MSPSSQNKGSARTLKLLSSKNHGTGTTLSDESKLDLPKNEKDPYLYSLELGDKHQLNCGAKMQLVVLQTTINELYSKELKIKKDAEEWFSSTEDGYIFSFESICLTFNLDPDSVRKALVEKRWDWQTVKFRTNIRGRR